MKYPVISKIKKISSIVFANVLILGLTGIVHAQSQNLKGEYTQKSVITEKKSANKHRPKNELQRCAAASRWQVRSRSGVTRMPVGMIRLCE